MKPLCCSETEAVDCIRWNTWLPGPALGASAGFLTQAPAANAYEAPLAKQPSKLI